MPDMTPAPRRRPLWRLFILPVLLVVAAAAWSAFWFYAASEVGVRADAWAAQEAKSGRVYACASRSVAGFPFRLEVSCEDASVSLVSQTAGAQAPFTARLGEILVIAQIYQPQLLIAEFKAPATLSDRGQPPSMKVNWTLGQSSVVGLPGPPQRASIEFENASLDRVNGPVETPLARASHIELHGRLADGSSKDNPVIETALQIRGGSVLEVHPVLAAAFDADIQTRLTGLKDLSPKPWPERFREMQAAGGHVEITRSRIQQGDLVSVAAGTLRLNEQGRIDGELQMTVAGIEKVIPLLGIEKMLEEGVPQATLDRVAPGVKTQDLNNLFGALDRAIPGLGKVVKQNANAGVTAGINALGKETELEGRKARAFPMRFVDGAVFLGPMKVGQVPPLFSRLWWVARSRAATPGTALTPSRMSLRSSGLRGGLHDQVSVRSATPGSPKRDRRDGNVAAEIPVLFSDGPHRWVDSEESKMTTIRILGAATALALLAVSAPASAQHMIDEPGNFAFFYPNGDLGIGSARPSVEAQAMAPRLVMRHPIAVHPMKPRK